MNPKSKLYNRLTKLFGVIFVGGVVANVVTLYIIYGCVGDSLNETEPTTLICRNLDTVQLLMGLNGLLTFTALFGMFACAILAGRANKSK